MTLYRTWLLLVALILASAAEALSPEQRSAVQDSDGSVRGPAVGGGACAPLPRAAVTGSVFVDPDGTWRFEPGVLEGAAAHAAYVDSSSTPSNFGKLRIVTSGSHRDVDQVFGAGFLEGWLTAERIFDHHHNLKAYFTGTLNVSLTKPMAWIHKQDAWVRSKVRDACCAGGDANCDGGGRRDGYWTAVGLVLKQWDGLVAGYTGRSRAAAAARPDRQPDPNVGALTREDLLFLHSNGDLYDLIDKYEAEDEQTGQADATAATRDGGRGAARQRLVPRSSRVSRRRYQEMGPGELWQALALAGKCSALVKVKEDLSEIFFGHSTWDNFMAMLRIFKHYEFNLRQVTGLAAQRLSFSSYPGELFSDDDLYMTDARLVVLETTNHIYNPDVFQALTPKSVLSWQRVRVANMLAASGAEWVALLKKHNSGTYNNQYMVTDLNKFYPGKYMAPGMFHVVEQLPGFVESADLTSMLARGYWPSYNVAFFPRVYNTSGYPDFIDATEHRGTPFEQPAGWLKYQTSPRANIFRRDQSTARDIAAFKHLMRYNDWRHDPLSQGAPFASVCGRGDLAPEGADFGPVLKGCYDSKVTTASMALELRAEVVNGPTAQGQPPFEWKGRWANVKHRGMPDRFDFSFEAQSPEDLPLELNCSPGGHAQLPAAAAPAS